MGASVRVYQNGELTVAGVQNSLARFNAESALTSTGQCAPYEISGRTTVKILMTPNESYKYKAIPSMAEGVVSADDQGYVTLNFDDTSHEIFFLLKEGSTVGFDAIEKMQQEWETALEFSIE